MTKQQYEMFGLINDLLLVSTYRLEHIPAVNSALHFIQESRSEYESNQPKTEETTEAPESGSDGKGDGKTRTRKVRKQK